MQFDITKMSSKGQIVIPQGIRDAQHLAEGDTFAIYEHQGLLVLKKLSHQLTAADAHALHAVVHASEKTSNSVSRNSQPESCGDVFDAAEPEDI